MSGPIRCDLCGDEDGPWTGDTSSGEPLLCEVCGGEYGPLGFWLHILGRAVLGLTGTQSPHGCDEEREEGIHSVRGLLSQALDCSAGNPDHYEDDDEREDGGGR